MRASCSDSALGSLRALLKHWGRETRPPQHRIDMTDTESNQSSVMLVIFPAESHLKLEAQRAASNVATTHALLRFLLSLVSICPYNPPSCCPAIFLLIFPFVSSSIWLMSSSSFCSVRQDHIETHVVVIPGGEESTVNVSLPYVAKVSVGRRRFGVKFRLTSTAPPQAWMQGSHQGNSDACFPVVSLMKTTGSVQELTEIIKQSRRSCYCHSLPHPRWSCIFCRLQNYANKSNGQIDIFHCSQGHSTETQLPLMSFWFSLLR